MGKRTDIQSILIIGAGPIVIGQACEFDYSGTQACKALKEDGYRTILVNSNPATIMTDPNTADSVYIEPITPEIVEKIIIKERPDAILPTVGGQTALNCTLGLHERGTLEKYNTQILGASPDSIDKAENRKRFNEAMANIGLSVPKNAVVTSLEDGLNALETIGLPAIIRPSFTLGGSGGGIAKTKEEFIEIVSNGLDISPTSEVLIDESILGWKEYEMEVIRDKHDNAIIVCSIENLDPMGVHTGDSITVAPALTLTDKEYQQMRNASIAILREIGVETGGSNVQFAVHPKTGKLIVIEMNPRVSRSSALASKATGYPIAKIAAKLAVGYTLDEIMNDITGTIPASFEPTIDYIVTKIPRFTFEKFQASDTNLSSQMKSVGEVMSIGRSFSESLQKGLRSLEIGLNGLDTPNQASSTIDDIKADLSRLSPDRILHIAHAFRNGISMDEIHDITFIDPWFLSQIKSIVDTESLISNRGTELTDAQLLSYKKIGFSDQKIAELTKSDFKSIMMLRHQNGIKPVYKKVDTCAAEFMSQTPYLYSCYEGQLKQVPCCESEPSSKKKVIILGGGPNRIGQGIEFDYACVHAALSLSAENYESIMVNCNPETVSTDYDTSDKLYFEPLTHEDVYELILKEQSNGTLIGVVVQFGGQTPLKLAQFLNQMDIPIIGTNPDMIDLAEDRERFQLLLNKLDLKQPENTICHSIKGIQTAIASIGYPVVIRPSHVLGGRAMAIIYNQLDLDQYLKENETALIDGPILIDRFLNNAVEIDVDAISDGDTVYVAGIMEHIEEAGIHSGDSACSLPPYSLSTEQINQVEMATHQLATALNVIGLVNIQFAFQDNSLYVIEVNPRASRTVPFVAKATGNSIAMIAAKVMVGRKLSEFNWLPTPTTHYAIKEAVFPFARFSQTDTVLGPEMKSTGEVMGIEKDFSLAFAKAQIGAGNALPLRGSVLISVQDLDKPRIADLAKSLHDLQFTIYATKGTHAYLHDLNIPSISVKKEKEGGAHLVTLINNRDVQLVINTTSGGDDIPDSYSLRRATLMNRIPYVTTIPAANAAILAIVRMNETDVDVYSLSELFNY